MDNSNVSLAVYYLIIYTFSYLIEFEDHIIWQLQKTCKDAMNKFCFWYRPAIPPSITSTLRQKVPKAIFTSNPTRLQYCTQEIVVFREDLLSKVSRHCLHFPSDEDTRHHVSASQPFISLTNDYVHNHDERYWTMSFFFSSAG